MSEEKHTPGPWEVRETGIIYIANKNDVIPLCGCGWGIDKDGNYMENEKIVKRNLANARLIAVAPDMLEILQDQCSECNEGIYFNKSWCDGCKTGEILKKVRGEK